MIFQKEVRDMQIILFIKSVLFFIIFIFQHILEWSDDELTSQVFGFFLAGIETVSTLLSYAFYELAVHPDVQDKLIKEIDEVLKSNSKVTYEILMKMKYMDMFVSGQFRLIFYCILRFSKS